MLLSRGLKSLKKQCMVNAMPVVRNGMQEVPTERSLNFCSITNSVVQLQHLEGDEKGIAVVGLNRPEARNALGRGLVYQLEEVTKSVEFDKKVRVLILRSLATGIFCAGADLKERAKQSQDELKQFVPKLHSSVWGFARLPFPVIAAIDGSALGGGLELALSCDLRVAAENVKLGLVETGLAIIPGAGGTQKLPRLIGPAKAKELIFTAKTVDGIEAEEVGLVNYSVPQNENHDAAYQRSLQLAREILQNGPDAVLIAKNALDRGIEVDRTTRLTYEGNFPAQTQSKTGWKSVQYFRRKEDQLMKGGLRSYHDFRGLLFPSILVKFAWKSDVWFSRRYEQVQLSHFQRKVNSKQAHVTSFPHINGQSFVFSYTFLFLLKNLILSEKDVME